MRHLPAVDGLRGVAVVVVIAYHAELPWADGGFLGVEVFFVISGFLVTSLLLLDRQTHGCVRYGAFLWRRVTRLQPAALVALVAVSVVASLVASDAVGPLRGDIIATSLGAMNWGEIFTGTSYFEATGRPPLLQHLWSLAVEYQLYVLWPPVAAAVLRRHGRKGLATAAGLGVMASTVLMAMVLDPDSPTRAYYGTDTRASGFLVGALVAASGIALRSPTPRPGARVAIDAAAIVALAALVLQLTDRSEFDLSLYRGGFLHVAALTAATVVAAATPGTVTARLLGHPLARAVGVRSYGLYLWHWPIFQLTRPGIDIPLAGLPALAVRVAATAVASELSFRYVERPAMHALRARRIRDGAPRRLATASAVVTAMCVLLLGTGPGAPIGDTVRTASAAPRHVTDATIPTPTAPTAPVPVAGPRVSTVHAVGDSVLLSARDALAQELGAPLTVDAVIGRQPIEGVEAIERWEPTAPGEALVVALGSNGILRAEHVARIVTAAGPARRVVFVNTAVGRRWADESNTVLEDALEVHRGVALVDWASIVRAEPGMLGPDRIHPSVRGALAYARAVAAALGVDAARSPVLQAPAAVETAPAPGPLVGPPITGRR